MVETGKLIRGVIYDDINMDEMIDDMFEIIDEDITDVMKQCPYIKEVRDEIGISYEEQKSFYKTMDTLYALTRYNFDTGVTHNLIIPKESLSENLVDELDKVDFGKDLLNKYMTNFVNKQIAKTQVEPENFCRGEEECLLKHVDKQSVKEPKYFIDGKRVSKEEMEESLRNNPAFSQLMSMPIFNTFGEVSCF